MVTLLLAMNVQAQFRVDSLSHFGLRGEVLSVSNAFYEVRGSDTIPMIRPTYKQEFYSDGLMKSHCRFDGNGLLQKKKEIEKMEQWKLGLKNYSYDPSPKVESFAVLEYTQAGKPLRKLTHMSPTNVEEEAFVYENEQLKKRVVTENGNLLSNFVYEYADGQKSWRLKTEFNSEGTVVDTKMQVFDAEERLVQFVSKDDDGNIIEKRFNTYLADSVQHSATYLRNDQDVLELADTSVSIYDGELILQKQTGEDDFPEKTIQYQYDPEGRRILRLTLNAAGDTLEWKTTEHLPNEGRIDKKFNSKKRLIEVEEVERNMDGRRIYDCNWTESKERERSFSYDQKGNVILVDEKLTNAIDRLMLHVIETRTVTYYE